MEAKNCMNRRAFLKNSAIGVTSLAAAPTIIKASGKAVSPSDRITVGFVGVGARAHQLIEAVKACGGTEIVAVCDAYKGRIKRALQRTNNRPSIAKDYKEIINRSDIDVVVVATQDHWHKIQVVDALEAGKDVYCEKPLTYSVEEGLEIIDAVKRTGQILQVGSQGMSSMIQKKAKEMIQSGALGQITMIRASYNRNTASGAWIYPIPPDGHSLTQGQVDWDMFLGPAPKRPYDPARFFRWRCYWDYSGGIATDLFVHLCTTIHFLMDAKAPDSVIASGELYRWKESREVPDTLNAIYTYPEGFTVNMSSTFNNQLSEEAGFEILGTEGSVTIGSDKAYLVTEQAIDNNDWIVESWSEEMQAAYYRDKEIQKKEAPFTWEPTVRQTQQIVQETGLNPTAQHFREFLKAVLSRQQPLEDAAAGHRAASCAHMVNMSVKYKKVVNWDHARDTVKA